MDIPYIDAKKPQDVPFEKNVQDNIEGFTKKEITTDKLSRKSQGMIGHLSDR